MVLGPKVHRGVKREDNRSQDLTDLKDRYSVCSL